MSGGTQNQLNSLDVVRMIRRFERTFGSRVLQNLEKRMHGEQREVTWDDIQACAGIALEEFQAAGFPDEVTVESSMRDIEAGRTKTIQEVIDALPN